MFFLSAAGVAKNEKRLQEIFQRASEVEIYAIFQLKIYIYIGTFENKKCAVNVQWLNNNE